MLDAQEIHAVCWKDAAQCLFDWAPSWRELRAAFDERVGAGSSDERIADARVRLPCLSDNAPCAGFAPDQRRQLPGVYQGFRISLDEEPRVLVVTRGQGALVVLAGPDSAVRQRLGSLIPYERYVLAQHIPEGERRPTSLARKTASAERVLDMIRAGSPVREQLTALDPGELIWIAQRARQLRRQTPSAQLNRLVGEATAVALSIQRVSDTLNLRAAELRDFGALDASEAVSRESIALCESPERNPYGYAGLAATLRRMGRYDDAYDLVKRALRHYPNELPLLRLKQSLIRT